MVGFRLINSRRSGLSAWKSGCLKVQLLIRINISEKLEEQLPHLPVFPLRCHPRFLFCGSRIY